MLNAAAAATTTFAAATITIPFVTALSNSTVDPFGDSCPLPIAVGVWVRKSMAGSFIVLSAFLYWVVYFQLSWRSWGAWVTDWMAVVPSKDLTGW